MSSSETLNCDKFYKNVEKEFVPLDVYTAASLGNVSFFTKYNIRELQNKLSTPNSSGWTPLMYACSTGHSLLINYLLMSGASRKCATKSGVTPLMLAISSGNMSAVESVFDFSSLEEKDYRYWTPLFYSVHFSREKCLNYLLNRGANVNIVDFQNETPLMVAIKLGRETMVELLLKSAKNLDVVSYKQESALMLADESNNVKIQTLVKRHYEYLMMKKNVHQPSLLVTPKGNCLMKRKLQNHCSPTPLKQQIKSQLKQIKMSKSLTYTPNTTPQSSPKTPNLDSSPMWKALQRKFWSPQLNQCNDVEEFLKGLGLEKYWPIFRDEEVDFETLMTLNEDNLKELGIVLFGPRKKIYLAIQQLRNQF